MTLMKDPYASKVFLDMDLGYGRGAKLLDKSPFHSYGDITTAAWAMGKYQYALDFNSAIPDYVEVTCPQLNFTSEDFSIIVRINIDDLTAARYIFIRGLADIDGYRFYISATGHINFRTDQSGASQASYSAAGAITTGTWYTVGVTRLGNSVVLYKDGVDINDTAGSHTNPATCARTAKIGIYNDKSTAPFDGKIEFLRIFGGIALPAEAHAWYHNVLK